VASDERKEAGDLSRFNALKDAPETYHIFQALRLIEAAYADTPRLGRSRRPKQDAVRLKQRVNMAFASSTVARFVPRDDRTGKPGELAQYMFGLFGPNGPLPLHLTEYAYNRQRSFRDQTFKAFGDMFHHRMLSLFYRAYASGEPTSSFDRKGEEDPFAQKVAAFAGLKGAAFANRDAMPDLAKLRYAGRLSHGTRNEEGLLALISGFFGAPATMESFVGTWLELDKKDTWELGNPHKPAKLGQSCSIGSKVWTRQAKFRFRVGPVGLVDYKRLLPGGDSLKRLKALVNNYMGEALMWDMNLVLKAGEAEPAILGKAVADDEVSVVVHAQDATPPAPEPTAPLDLEKTVVLPGVAPPAPAATSREADIGAAVESLEDSAPIPPLTAKEGHEDDTRPAPKGVYLGWTTWLGTPPGDQDLDQLYIQSDAQPGE
jgi:type VI secretion system protein ImpH